LPQRKLAYHAQCTLDLRIADDRGELWSPFVWGEPQQAWLNGSFRTADTWAMSRVMYEAIVPWWEAIATGQSPAETAADAEFAGILHRMTKVVFSRTLARPGVIHGDLAAQLAALKEEPGGDIVLSCGPGTLGPLANAPGLIDEYLLVLHPAVLRGGPRVFDLLDRNLALELVHAEPFAPGCVALRYRVQRA
jgi:dihydrofolate reductase